MSIQEILTGGGGVLLVLLTLVQISPIELNPWSALAKVVGRAINADVTRELSEIKEKLDGHVTMDDRRNADGHRTRILHFNNELLRGIEHTKEEFIEALAEIDAYERYCAAHDYRKAAGGGLLRAAGLSDAEGEEMAGGPDRQGPL